jgi:protein phosphatase
MENIRPEIVTAPQVITHRNTEGVVADRELVRDGERPHRSPDSTRGSRESTPALVLDAAGASHPGRRRLNQDQFLIADLGAARRREADQGAHDQGESLLVVADGLGGHPSGEVASLLAVRVLLRELLDDAPDGDNKVRRLERAMRSSDDAILRAGARRGDLASMGTTLTAAWWRSPMLYFAHVGHSRLYLLRAGRLVRLTRDHTIAAGMTEAGFEEAKAAGFEHVLTQALGGDHAGIEPEAGCRRLDDGDTVLLCTDGLLRGLDEDRITRTLEQAGSAHDAAMGLLESALATDDHDNTTALVARVKAVPAHAFPAGRGA